MQVSTLLTMAELKIPVDFERLPEYRQLADQVSSPTASFLMLILFADLAYQAESTTNAGFLSDDAVKLFLSRVLKEGGAKAGEGGVKVLQESGWLRAVPGGWQCDRFAKTNGHLAAGHQDFHQKGAAMSRHVRAQKRFAEQAIGQASLLPPETYKRKDGTPLAPADLSKCLICIYNLDSCLGRSQPRQARELTEGLMADAAEVVGKFTPEMLQTIYKWILDRGRNNPQLPKTAEQVLGDFGIVQALILKG